MSLFAGLKLAQLAACAFRWAGTHLAPWAACFLAGVIWHAKGVAEKEITAIEAEKDQAIAALASLRGRRAAEAERDRLNEEIRQQEWEGLQDVFATHEPVTVADQCLPDDRERQRVRQQTEAVDRYLAGIVSRRASGSTRPDSTSEAARASADQPR